MIQDVPAHRLARLRAVTALLDLTRLEDGDHASAVHRFCQRSDSPLGSPAAVCVHPQFIATAQAALAERGLNGRVMVATVANFPTGQADPDSVAFEVAAAVRAGADEIDVVFPWQALRAGDTASGQRLVAVARETAGSRCLKVILESGMLADPDLIRTAGEIAIAGGADFLKTSTGKVPINATLEAARVLLALIREHDGKLGFKASGGIRSLEDAEAYLALAGEIMGSDWVRPDTVRLGASSLLDDLLARLPDASTGIQKTC